MATLSVTYPDGAVVRPATTTCGRDWRYGSQGHRKRQIRTCAGDHPHRRVHGSVGSCLTNRMRRMQRPRTLMNLLATWCGHECSPVAESHGLRHARAEDRCFRPDLGNWSIARWGRQPHLSADQREGNLLPTMPQSNRLSITVQVPTPICASDPQFQRRRIHLRRRCRVPTTLKAA